MMSLFLHLRDKVFRVRDQGVLPVPLDPDLLFIAENAKQSNIIQELYRTQMERNRSRGPFGDAGFDRSKHPFDPKTGEFVETGTGTTSSAGKALNATLESRIDEVVEKEDFGKASASKTGRSPKRPYVPIIDYGEQKIGVHRTKTQQIRGMAFATRAEAVKYAEEHIEGLRDDLRDKLTQKGQRALRRQHGLPEELEEERSESERQPLPKFEPAKETKESPSGVPGEPPWRRQEMQPGEGGDWHHRMDRSRKHKHKEHEEGAERSREAWDNMSPVERRKWFEAHPNSARILARKNKPPYDEPQRLLEKSNGKFVIHKEHESYGGSQDPYFYYHWVQVGNEYANRETAEKEFDKRTSMDEYRKREAEKEVERANRETERRAQWEAGRPAREAAEAKKQSERAKKEEALPADLKKLKSLIEKLPDEGKKGFAKSLIDRHIEKGNLTPNQQPWVQKLIDLAEHGVTKDPAIQKTAEKLAPIKHRLSGRDLEAAESMLEQFNSRGSLSERQQSYFESLLRKANRATGDAEFKEHEHPRDEDGKFTAGAAKAKVPSAAPVGAPKAEQPKPSPSGVSLEEVTGQLSPLMGRHGYKFSKYEESSGQVTYVHANGSEVKFDKVRARWEWQYRSPEGKKRAGGSMLDLKEVLESGDFAKPEPIKVQPSTEQVLKKLPKSLKDQLQISNYIYREAQNLGTDMARYVFYDPRKYGNRIEYGVEDWGEGHYWEHVDAEHERRYWGYGNLSLIGHMKRYEKGEVFDSKFAKDFGDKLFSNVSISGGSIFQPIIEGDTAVVFRNGYGDDIFIYKDYDKATLDTAKWKIMMSHEDGDKRPYNEGTGWEELKANLSSLEDDRATENARAKVERDEHHARLNEIGRSVIKRLGYDPDRLIVTDEDHEFMLNGSKHFAGGTHWADGRIMLHAKRLKNLSSTVIEGLVAHETMHEKFQRVMEEYKEERGEVREDKRDPTPTGHDPVGYTSVQKPDDTLREEFHKDYPVYAKLEPVLGYASNKSAKLAETDGVTDYSRQYWEEYQSGAASWKQGGGLELAINETLAEMAHLEVTDPAQFKTIAKPWRDLYKDMVTFYRERDKRRAFKSEHAEERASWRAKKEELPIAASPTPHPAVTQLAHALHQVLNLGDKAWNKADHPQAPEGAPEGAGGQFVKKGTAVGGGTEPSKQTESRKKSEIPHIKAPVTNKPLPGVAKGSDPATISSRVPTTVGATDDKYRRADVTAMRENDWAFDHNTALFDQTEYYPNFRPGELDCPPARGDASDCADRRVGIIMRHMKKNLKFLYDNAPKEVREQGHKWYEGAHNLAQADADKYGLPLPSVAGVYAALSPQTLWDLNVHLAKTVLDIYHTKQDFKWDKKMEATAKEIWSAKNYALLVGVRDKTLGELTSPAQKALWIRTYDETYNKERSFNALSPDGRVIGKYKNLDGSNYQAGWNSNPPIIAAIKALESGGDREIISPAMGEQHKVRSFYNNILDPDSDNKDVTIDTHAVGAALLRALGGTSVPVMQSFGKGPSKKEDSIRLHYRGTSSKGVSTKGLYSIYADAYRSLAKELGIKPRVLQSITWEAKRRLFDERMTDEQKNSVEEAWRKYHNDKASLEETQKAIVKAAGGFAKGQEGTGDNTGERSTSGVSQVDRRTSDSRKLDRVGVGSQSTRSVDPRRRGYDTRGIAVGARRIWANARFAVLLR